MRRSLALALAAAGILLLLVGLVALLGDLSGVGARVGSILLGGSLLVAGVAGLRPAEPVSRGPVSPPPYVGRPLHEPREGEPPVVRVGMGLGWNWSPDNPLGGSASWNRFRNPASWDWEYHSRHDLRFLAPAGIDEGTLRRAAKRACDAARRTLERRGGVKVHGESREEAGRLLLTLKLDVHSMQVPDANREAAVKAFAETFARESGAAPA